MDIHHPAVRALSQAGRRALHLIEQETAGGQSVAITRDRFQLLARLAPKSATSAKRQLESLGFVRCTVGPHKATVYELSDGWRTVDANEAQRRLAALGKARGVL